MRRSIIFLTLFMTACGGAHAPFGADIATDAPPTVTRIDPTAARAGDAMTIFGFGFSSVPQKNIVSIGTTTTAATGYHLVDPPTASEIEAITLTVPRDVLVGDYAVVVTVHAHTSNTNVTLTVTP